MELVSTTTGKPLVSTSTLVGAPYQPTTTTATPPTLTTTAPATTASTTTAPTTSVTTATVPKLVNLDTGKSLVQSTPALYNPSTTTPSSFTPSATIAPQDFNLESAFANVEPMRELIPAAEPETQSVFDRIGNTLSGAGKSYVSSVANAFTSGLEGITRMSNNGSVDTTARFETYITEMEEKLAQKPWNLTEEQYQSELDALATMKSRYQSQVDTGETMFDRGYQEADALQLSAQADIDKAKENAGTLGQLAVDLGVAGTQLAGDVGIGLLSGGSAIPALAVRSYGGGTQQARQEGADYGQQLTYGGLSAATSVLVERLTNFAPALSKQFGTGYLDDVVQNVTGRLGSTAVGKVALSALGEGSEEMIEAVVDPILQNLTYTDGQSVDVEEVLYNGLVGALLGGVLGTPSAVAGALSTDQAQGQKNTVSTGETAEFYFDGSDSDNSWNNRTYKTDEGTFVQSKDRQRMYEVPTQGQVNFDVLNDGTVVLNDDIVSKLQKDDYRDFLKAYAQLNLVTQVDPTSGAEVNAKPITIQSDGRRVVITQTGINDVAKKMRGASIKSQDNVSSILLLDKIIEQARPQEVEANQYGGTTPFTKYKSRFSVGDRAYDVTLKIKNAMQGDRYHYHTLDKIDVTPVTAATTPKGLEHTKATGITSTATNISQTTSPVNGDGLVFPPVFGADGKEVVAGADTAGQNNTASTGETVQASTSSFPQGILENLNKARTYFTDYVKKNFPATVVNQNTGREIGISSNGIKKFLSGRISNNKYASGFHIPALIEQAKKVDSKENYHTEQVATTPTFDYYESHLEIDGKPYTAKIRVRNNVMGDKYYGHTLSEVEDIEIVPSAPSSSEQSSSVHPVNAIEDTISATNIPQTTSPVNGDGLVLPPVFGADGKEAVVGADTAGQNNTASTGETVQASTSSFPQGILENLTKARAYFVDYAKKNFPATVVNQNTGREIGISRNGIDKFLSGNILSTKYASGLHIPALIEKATPVAQANNYHARQENNTPTYDYYNSALTIDGEEYTAHIRVKNNVMGDKYYGHTISEVDKIEIAPFARSSSEQSSSVHPVNSSEDTISATNISQTTSPVNGDGLVLPPVFGADGKEAVVGADIAGQNNTVTQNLTENSNVRRYEKEIDGVFDGTLPSGANIVLGKTPDIMKQHGAPDLNLHMTQSVARKIAYPKGYYGGKHGLGISALKNLLGQIENPMAIINNPQANQKNLDSKIILTEWVDEKGQHIIVPIHFNAQGAIELQNNVASVFGANYISHIIGENGKNVVYTRNNENIGQLLSKWRPMPQATADDTLVAFNLSQNPSSVNGDNLVLPPVFDQNGNEVMEDRAPLPKAGEKDPMELEEVEKLYADESAPEASVVPERVAWGLTGDGVSYNKDFARNLDKAAGSKKDKEYTTRRKWLKDNIETPFLQGKKVFSSTTVSKLNDLKKQMDGFGIQKGTEMSAAVQWYGEGKRTNSVGEVEEYTLDTLKREFPDTWESIKAAEEWTRALYDDYVVRVNQSLEQVYPNLEEDTRTRLANLEATVAVLDSQYTEKLAQLEVLERSGGDQSAVENLRKEAQAKKSALDMKQGEMNALSKSIETGDYLRNKRLVPRKDYFHHFTEQEQGFAALGNILSTPADIDPTLVGVSDNTKPKSKWAGFLQQRTSEQTEADAVGGLLRYIPAAEYKINLDPVIAQNRATIKGLVEQTRETRNANGLIEWLTDWTNDLAGKTNPIDRPVQKVIGRKAMKGLQWLNSRVKGNAILGNVNSAVSQFFNLPNATSYIKNPKDWVAGVRAMAKEIAGKGTEMGQSGFLTERYMDSAVAQFDEGVFSTPRKAATWMLNFGDEVASRLIWSSAYNQAKRTGEADPIAVADDVTRRSVAGRGVGEVPLLQKSEVTKFIAPFQVEVNNAWQALKEKVSEKDATGLMLMFITSWLMNNVAQTITGNRVSFDPIDAILSALGDREEDDTPLETAGNMAKRVGGELLSNMPFGTTIAQTLVSDETVRESIFGESDPTRYGTGNIGVNMLMDPFTDFVSGREVDLLSPLLNIGLPFGGKQAERTIEGLQNTGVLPRVGLNSEDGFWFEPAKSGVYSSKDKMSFAMDEDIGNQIKSVLLGPYSTTAGQEYLENASGPLSAEWTAIAEAAVEAGMSASEAYQMVRSNSTQSTWKSDPTAGTNPAYYTEGEPEVDAFLATVLEQSGVSLSVPARTITVDGESTALTGDQWVTFAKERGALAYDVTEELVASDIFLELNQEAQGKALEYVNQYADQSAKTDLGLGYDSDNWVEYAQGKTSEQVGAYAALKAEYDVAKAESKTWELDALTMEYVQATKDIMGAQYALQVYNTSTYQKAQEAQELGVSYDNYLDAYFAQKDVVSDKDENGNTVYLSSSANKKAAIDAVTAGMSVEEREVLYELFGVSEKVW